MRRRHHQQLKDAKGARGRRRLRLQIASASGDDSVSLVKEKDEEAGACVPVMIHIDRRLGRRIMVMMQG